jgi:hypothetical protein
MFAVLLTHNFNQTRLIIEEPPDHDSNLGRESGEFVESEVCIRSHRDGFRCKCGCLVLVGDADGPVFRQISIT